MVPIASFLAFLLTTAVIVAVPGPSVLFTIGRALTVGRRSTVMTVVGNSAGVYLQVVAVAFGMGALVERWAHLYTVVKYAGAAYVVYLGVQAIRHRRSMAEALGRRVAPVTPLRAARDGLVVGATNPKTIVFLLGVMPGYADPSAGHLTGQLLLLGTAFPVVALVLDNVWAFAAGTARQWFTGSPRRLELIGGAGGLAMVGVGATLAVTGRKD